jgi:hypothetical protein
MTRICRLFYNPPRPEEHTLTQGMLMMRLIFRIVLLSGFSFSISSPVQSQSIHTIALTGQHAPGTVGDLRFYGVGDGPFLSSQGQVVFAGDLSGQGLSCPAGGVCNESGAWIGDATSLALVGRGGDEAPGFPAGSRLSRFGNPPRMPNSDGPLIFYGYGIEPNGDGYHGLWAGAVGSFTLAFREGEHAPGTSPEFTFYNFGSPTFDINSSGRIALLSTLMNNGIFNWNHRDEGIWSGTVGSLSLVAQNGQHAPGMPADTYFDDLSHPSLSAFGHVAFYSSLAGPQIGYQQQDSLWSDRSGSLALIARYGDPAPGLPSGVFFRTLGYDPKLDAAAHVAFRGEVAGPGITDANNEGFWSDVGGSLALIARTGDHAPGTLDSVNFGTLGDTAPLFNSSGKIAFVAGLIGSGIDRTNGAGIWSDEQGTLRPVVRLGDSAPGGNGKVFGNFDDLMLNAAGQVAFRGFLTDPGQIYDCCSGVVTTKGLWAEDKLGNLHLIVREGGQIEVAPGDMRTVESFWYAQDRDVLINGDGDSNSFNGRGQFAFVAYFTDGTGGVFVSDVAAVPEPASDTLVFTLFLFLFVPPSRKRPMRMRV